MIPDFFSKLKNRLAEFLPGEEAQFAMAPLKRKRLSEIPLETYQPRKSAVLILLFPANNSIHTLLIRRPEYEGAHSGQAAFPGGKFEESDRDLEQTALREAREEIGIDPEKVKIIGHLTDLYIPTSNFLVRPFIGYSLEEPVLLMDPREVQEIIEADLFSLDHIVRRGETTIQLREGYKVKTPYYDIEGLIVWGATAMIISELNAVVNDVKAISS
ncbi:MAG TPA: CoA pyrophosphatase [Bacteroidia bacterium]|jgi:8-oxo-dGTP pyrophosphatase MutT (NUDIX family)